MRQTLVFQIMQLEIFFTTYYMFDKLIYLDCKITVSPAIFFLLGKQRFREHFPQRVVSCAQRGILAT